MSQAHNRLIQGPSTFFSFSFHVGEVRILLGQFSLLVKGSLLDYLWPRCAGLPYTPGTAGWSCLPSQLHILKMRGRPLVTGLSVQYTFLNFLTDGAVPRPQGLWESPLDRGMKYRWLLSLPRFSESFLRGGRRRDEGSPALEYSLAPIHPTWRLQKHTELGRR